MVIVAADIETYVGVRSSSSASVSVITPTDLSELLSHYGFTMIVGGQAGGREGGGLLHHILGKGNHLVV